jgi:hypothetical protein
MHVASASHHAANKGFGFNAERVSASSLRITRTQIRARLTSVRPMLERANRGCRRKNSKVPK